MEIQSAASHAGPLQHVDSKQLAASRKIASCESRSALARSDAAILLNFRDVMQPFAHLEGAALQAAVAYVGMPIVRRLQANGHDLATVVGLMRETLNVLRNGAAR